MNNKRLRPALMYFSLFVIFVVIAAVLLIIYIDNSDSDEQEGQLSEITEDPNQEDDQDLLDDEEQPGELNDNNDSLTEVPNNLEYYSQDCRAGFTSLPTGYSFDEQTIVGQYFGDITTSTFRTFEGENEVLVECSYNQEFESSDDILNYLVENSNIAFSYVTNNSNAVIGEEIEAIDTTFTFNPDTEEEVEENLFFFFNKDSNIGYILRNSSEDREILDVISVN